MTEFILKIRISPNSSKNEIIKSDDNIKIKITALPIEGKANKALIEFLSKEFKIPKTSIEIIKGSNSKEKTLKFNINEESKIIEIKNKLS